jgi:hypothetical protein
MWWLIRYNARCVVDSDNATYIVIATTGQSAKTACCRPVSSEAQRTGRFRAARCRDVTLSLGL